MNWDVVTKLSPPEIQLHWATAVLAFAIAPVIFLNAKGTRLHVTLGAFYAVLMVVTSVSAFFVRGEPVSGWDYLSLKGMSFVHLFVPTTLIGVIGGVGAMLFAHDRRGHRGGLVASYIGGLVIAGAFTFLPGRRMNLFFFGEPERVQALVERSVGG